MNMTRVSGLAFLVVAIVGVGAANGGDRHHRPRRRSSGHHTPRVIIGGGGHHTPRVIVGGGGHHTPRVIVGGSRHRNQYVVPHGSSYVLPRNTHHSGSYYTLNGNHYYYSQTASVGDVHVTQQQPRQIRFGGFSQLDDLAGRLETMANNLCLDLHYNYSHNKNYNAIYREAYQILETAKYIHTAKHQRNHKAVQERLSGLDKLAHHVEGELAGWSRDHHQQVGQLGLHSKMKQIQSTLHHLLNDVGVKPTSVTQGHH